MKPDPRTIPAPEGIAVSDVSDPTVKTPWHFRGRWLRCGFTSQLRPKEDRAKHSDGEHKDCREKGQPTALALIAIATSELHYVSSHTYPAYCQDTQT